MSEIMNTSTRHIAMTISVDQDDQHSRPSKETDVMDINDSSHSNVSSNCDDAPITPPRQYGRSDALSSHSYHGAAGPPEIARHGRPINRRLFLEEAQERLSLPDLFAPRTSDAPSRRSRTARTSRMFLPCPAASNSSRHLQQSMNHSAHNGATVSLIHPHAEYLTGYGQSMSQRSFLGNADMF